MSDYGGFANRETWAADRWIREDTARAQSARARLHELVAAHEPTDSGDELRVWWEDLTDPSGLLMDCPQVLAMVRDIGDERLINWSEIAEGLVAE